MVAPAVRLAVRYAPVAIEVARQLDKQLRPHVLAYRHAREIDGYIARWTTDDGTHWVVFPDRQAAPVAAFPPIADAELAELAALLDRAVLQHHLELPEARIGAGVRTVSQAPQLLLRRRPRPR